MTDRQHNHYPQYAASSALPQSTNLSSLNTQHLQPNDRYDADDMSQPVVSPIMSRSPSLVSDDRFSNVSALTTQFPSSPSNVRPAPAYVAAFGAAQVVADHQSGTKRKHSSDEDDALRTASSSDVQFSPTSLAVINAFLDQLLYSFLSHARSTSLGALRPAVTEVLRSRLASEAIASAEEELQELLAGGDDEDEMDLKQSNAEQKRGWDLELVWKRTRLRVMVYIRLGEMEDDDEERYVRDEDLFHGSERRFSQSTGLVSWAAAIFLTSVLEHVAEQVIQVAGQAATNRVRRRGRIMQDAGPDADAPADGITVEDHDVEKVALNAALGRLWRTWRKTNRGVANHVSSPTQALHDRHYSRDSMAEERRGSFDTAPESMPVPEELVDEEEKEEQDFQSINARDSTAIVPEDIPEAEYSEHVLAANIPLPISDDKRDVVEIEVPGLAVDPDAELDDGDESFVDAPAPRRNSLPHAATTIVRTTSDAAPTQPAVQPKHRPTPSRKRSNSTPGRGKHFDTRVDVPVLHHDVDETSEDEAAQDLESLKVLELAEIAVPDEDKINGELAALEEAAALSLPLDEDEKPVLPTAANLSDEQIAELDKQKHFFPPEQVQLLRREKASPVSGSSQESVSAAVLVPAVVEDSPKAVEPSAVAETTESDKVVDEEQTLPQRSEEATDILVEQPVVAPLTTEATIVPPPESQIEVSMPQEDNVQVKEADDDAPSSSRPSSINLTDETPATDTSSPANRIPPSPIEKDNVELLEEAALEQPPAVESAIVEIEAESTISPPSDDPAAALLPTRQLSQRSIAAAAPTTPEQEMPQWRKSLSTMLVRARSLSRSASASDARTPDTKDVQEHPIIQRMASIKNKVKPAEDEAGLPLTSASIKGPQDFELFVQGDDTVKYTLTPGNVRDEPLTPPGTAIAATASDTALVAQAPIGSALSAEAQAGRDEALKRLTSGDATTDRSNDPLAKDADRTSRMSEKRRSTSRPARRNTMTHKSGMMAREPQVVTDSTRDIADFLRSTAPPVEQNVAPLIKSRSTVSLQSMRNAQGSGSRSNSRPTSSNGSTFRNFSRSMAQTANAPPVPPMPDARRQSLQPQRGGTDAIGVARTGPTIPGQRRFSRPLTSYRNTMDSDQMKDWSRSGSSPAVASGARSFSMKSASAYSRSAALSQSQNANETVHPAHSGLPQSLSARSKSTSTAPPSTGRTQYRNKDPYAIYLQDDDDDDDDQLISAVPRNRQLHEESIIDFLKSSQTTADADQLPPHAASAASAKRRSFIQAHGSDIFSGADPRQGSTPATALPSTESTTALPQLKPKMPPAPAVPHSTNDLISFLRRKSTSTRPTIDPLSAPAPDISRGARAGDKSNGNEKPKKRGLFGFSFFSRSNSGTGRKAYLDM